MASQEIDNLLYPNTTVVYIVGVFPDGTLTGGSGVIVGKNDVLTAAHVVYDSEHGGYAGQIHVVPGYDPDPDEQPFGFFDQPTISTNTTYGANFENDVAILGFNILLGKQIGMMWLDPYFINGTANLTGYPDGPLGAYGNNPRGESAIASFNVAAEYIDISNFEVWKGNSGGPLWRWDGEFGQVAGVVATGNFFGQGDKAASVGINLNQLISWMNANDSLVNDSGSYLIGDFSDDNFIGSDGGDQISGGEGDDTIYGAGGNDIIYGAGDNDTLNGEAGADELFGGAGTDALVGGSGNDSLIGGSGTDSLDGGTGNDTADYRTATTGLTVDLASPANNTGDAQGDTFTSIERLRGSAFADLLFGNSSSNTLDGGAGADALDGRSGFDYARYSSATTGVTASLANPAASTGDAAGDTYVSIEGLWGSNFADTLIGNGASNNLDGGAGADALNGQGGFDYARYQSANSGVTANLANPAANAGDAAGDTYTSIEGLIGSQFNDMLVGDNLSSNINTLQGRAGADVLNGMSGFDYAGYGYDGVPGPVTASLTNPTINTGEAEGDTYISIEGLIGTDFADTLIGDGSGNWLIGGLGADTLDGQGAFDYVSYHTAAGPVTVNLGNPAVNTGEAFGDTYNSIEWLVGSSFGDTLVGNDVYNRFRGLGGADRIDGGFGYDGVDYSGDFDSGGTQGVVVNLGLGTGSDGFGNSDTLTSIEYVIGTRFADTLNGSFGDDQFFGLQGADTIIGGDEFSHDAADYSSDERYGGNQGIGVNLKLGTAVDGFGSTDTLASIECVTGTNFVDSIIGDDNSNILRGLAEADTIEGGLGIDWVEYAWDEFFGGSGGVNVDLSQHRAIDGFGGVDTLSGIENVLGTSFADVIVGDVADNVIVGGLGADIMRGGGGNDIYFIDDAGEVVVENADEGVDTVRVAYSSYTLSANIEIVTFIGTGSFTAVGNGLANTLQGGSDNDTLSGLGGDDTLIGGSGAGDDTYDGGDDIDTVVYSSTTLGIVVNLSLLQNHATGGEIGTDQIANIENVVGGGGSDTITGNANVNQLDGRGGDDTLDGGVGADTMLGGVGNDAYFVDDPADLASENPGEGTDTVYSTAHLRIGADIEVLVLQGAADLQAYGNAGSNAIYGNAGSNVLDGDAGADSMYGGPGSDYYYVDNPGDNMSENANEGIDTVYSLASLHLGPNVEVLVLQGSDDLQAFGNTVSNAIYGNAGSNILDGGAENDSMYGGEGSDYYYVDHIADVVVENADEGFDTVYSTASLVLAPNVETLVLQGTGDFQGYGNTLTNSIYGNTGSNLLDGGIGGDSMYGGLGNDVYYVDNIADVLVENLNEGIDTVFSAASLVLAANVEQLVLQGSADLQAYGNALSNALFGNSGNNIIDGRGGADGLTGNAGNDTFFFAAGEANGDSIADFAGNGAAAGDALLFSGYGAGATFTNIDATHWQVNYNGGVNHDIITFANAASIHASDYAFV